MGMEMDEGGFEVCGLGWFWSEEVSGFWVSVGRGCFGGERRDKGERESWIEAEWRSGMVMEETGFGFGGRGERA